MAVQLAVNSVVWCGVVGLRVEFSLLLPDFRVRAGARLRVRVRVKVRVRVDCISCSEEGGMDATPSSWVQVTFSVPFRLGFGPLGLRLRLR